MNRSNVPYIVAAALLVLGVGGWGIFMTGGNHETPESTDTGIDAVDSNAGTGGTPSENVERAETEANNALSDAGFALGQPPELPEMLAETNGDADAPGRFDAGDPAGAVGPKATKKDVGLTERVSPEQPRASIAPHVIKNVVAGMKPAMKLCYESLLEEFPEASGKVLVTFRVEAEGSEGRVTVIEVNEESTLMDDRLLGCLTDAFGDAVFPVPDGGETVQVTYPFTFASK